MTQSAGPLLERAPESDRARLEAVWRRRAAVLSQRPVAAEAGANALRVVVVGIGLESYGIESADVAEVLPPVHCTPVPGAPPFLAGVVNIHGEIRPVADLRRLLDLEAVDDGGLAQVILLRRQGRELGLKVDRVEQIRRITAGEIGSREGLCADGPGRYLQGLTGETLMLLNTEALLAALPHAAAISKEGSTK